MRTQVILVDINPEVVRAWESVFQNNPEVAIRHESMLDQAVDAWVTPTNASGVMDGGLDLVIKQHFGDIIEARVQTEIARQYQGTLPIGAATCVRTGQTRPKYLISTPTMQSSSEDISHTLNVAYACAAAFQAMHMANRRVPGSIQTIALPGLGACTGQVPVELCAKLMWSGYHLYRRHRCQNFDELRAVIDRKLSGVTLSASHAPPTYTDRPLLEAVSC